MKFYEFSANEMTSEINEAIDYYLLRMYEEKIINKEQFNIMVQYRYIVKEGHFFGKWWNKYFNKNNNNLTRIIVKVIFHKDI